MKILLLAAVVFVALGTLAFLLLGPEPERRIPRITSDRVSKAPLVQEETPKAASARTASQGGAPIESAEFDPTREAVPSAEALRIQVVDREDRPIDGAEVSVFTLEDARRRFRPVPLPPEDGPRELLTRGLSQRGIYDLKAVPKDSLLIVAKSGDLSAFELIESPSLGATHILRLLPPRRIAVRVVDENERPLEGVRVQLSATRSRSLTEWTSSVGLVEWTLDATHPSLFRAETLAARASSLARDAEPQTVSFGINPEGVTEAKLILRGAHGLLVSIHSKSGEPLRGKWALSAELVPEVKPSFVIRHGRSNRQSFVFEGAQALIHGLRKGSRLDLTLESPGRLPVTERIVIPEEPLVSELAIVAGDLAPVLSFQVIDALGQAYAQKSIRVGVMYEREAPKSESPMTEAVVFSTAFIEGLEEETEIQPLGDRTVITDEEGRVSICLEADRRFTMTLAWPEENRGRAAFLMDTSFNSRDRTSKDPSVWFTRKIEALPPFGQLDLGVLSMPERPLIAAGVVTDSSGRPSGGARVNLHKKRKTTPSPEASVAMEFDPFEGDGSPLASVLTDESGAFRINSVLPADSYELEAVHKGAASTSVAVRIGKENHVLTLLSPGAIAGLVSHPFGPDLRLTVEAISEGERETYRELDPKVIPVGKPFEIAGLKPGLYTVDCVLEGQRMARVEGVQVTSGQTTKDPRLANLALGESFELSELTVLSPTRQPIRRAEVRISTRGGSSVSDMMPTATRYRSTDQEGRVRFLRDLSRSLTLRVTAKGYVPQVIEAPSFPLTVTMDAGAAIELTIPGLSDLAAEEEKHPGFRVRLDRVNEESRNPMPGAADALSEVEGESITIEPDLTEGWSVGMSSGGSSLTGSLAPGKETVVIRGVSAGKYRALISRAVAPQMITTDSGPVAIAFAGFDESFLPGRQLELCVIEVKAGEQSLSRTVPLSPEIAESLRPKKSSETPR